MNQTVSKGEIIFREGQPGNCAYIIEKGRVELSILIDSTQTTISHLEAGTVFGEMALIGDHLRSATAIASEETELIVIPEKYFVERLENSDKFISLLLKIVLQRYFGMRSRLDSILSKVESAPSLLIPENSLPDCTRDTVEAACKLEAENSLKYALDNRQLELYYQPVISLANPKITGCESLIRWRHPSRGLVPPSEFIGLAEETGLIIPIGQWIIEEASKACLRFLEINSNFAFVSINLSGKQFIAGDLVDSVSRIFHQVKTPPNKIKFEITESILMANPLDTAACLAALKEGGSTVAIDDFGTGYSSFSYLHRFPIDTLKIDKSFVSTMQDNSKSYEIVKSLCVLAKAIGMSVVAEGVETAEEHRLLCEMGIDYGQGYFYAKPMPEAEFIDFIKK